MPRFSDEQRFAVDHVRAVQHAGPTTLEDLAYACLRCNSRKGTNLTGIDLMTGEVTPLFDPRTDSWGEHFVMEGSAVVGRTAVGRTTAELLSMNDPTYVELRALLIEAGLF